MASVNALAGIMRDHFSNELWNSRVFDHHFWRLEWARLAAYGFVMVCVAMLILRSLGRRRPGAGRLAVPALVGFNARSRWSGIRHVPLMLFVVGLPFLFIALADPYSSLIQRNVSFQGRRISIMIDASDSMVAPFTAGHLNTRAASDSAFFTNVGAAERFVHLRQEGPYHDLMALIEFGNEAYVITPFTNDYDNVLLGIGLIGDVVEFVRFPDKGTIIGQAIDQSIQLFKAFNFLDAAGNLMVLFSDGEDSRVIFHGKSVDDVVADAVKTKIPIYFIRTSYQKHLGEIIPDEQWKTAVERTGGRFYAAADEGTILRAIQEIDRVSTGRIDVKQYAAQPPHFASFAMIALFAFSSATTLRLLSPWFCKFP
jgi:hypothetical protein